VLAGGADTAFVVFFAGFFFAALLRLPAAFFLPPRLGALRFGLFFLPAFFFADFLRFAPFLRPDFLRAEDFRAARLRLLFLRAAMCSLPRDADPAPCRRGFYARSETMGKLGGEPNASED
jgi:hypothetical protein